MLKVTWEDGALELLEGRDRFTRSAIRDEFRRDPQKDAIEFDPAKNGFLTPVAKGRYSVVWQLDEQRQQAVVRAVVPLTNVSDKLKDLKEYVERAVAAESKGARVR